MKKRLLLGTSNPEKVLILRSALASLPIEVLSLADLGIDIDVEEDGASLEDNAEKKARVYSAVSGLPVLAIDGGLRIEELPEEKQPGVFVRRIPGVEKPTDEEVLIYYERELGGVGGEGIAVWSGAMTLAISSERVFTRRFSFKAIMRSERKGRPMPGAPLNCLMIDPVSRKHYSEMAHEDRPDFEGYREFVEQHLSEF